MDEAMKERECDLAAPCVVCSRALDNLGGPGANQPMDGLEFFTPGHYGSAVFDPMDGTYLAINICDPCLKAKRAAGVVGTYNTQRQFQQLRGDHQESNQ